MGPFSILMANRGNKVIANDLNPDCIFYLKKNAELNKVQSNLCGFNMDAREFIRLSVSDPSILNINSDFLPINHFYMNLPLDAIEFLDAFIGIYKGKTEFNDPKIHIYAFSEFKEESQALIELSKRMTFAFKGIYNFKESDIEELYPVRDVS